MLTFGQLLAGKIAFTLHNASECKAPIMCVDHSDIPADFELNLLDFRL